MMVADSLNNPGKTDGMESALTPVSAGYGITDLDRIRSIPLHIAGNCGINAFCLLTVFGSVFVLFMDELGFDKTRIGILLSLMPFASVLALFVVPWTLRLGLKRAFVWSFGIRKFVIALLLFTPLVLGNYGTQAAFIWVVAVLVVFSILRSIGEAAFVTWYPDLIPKAMLGRFSAINTTVVTILNIVVLVSASAVIRRFVGTEKFLLLIGAGILLGAAGVICYARLPGGHPVPRDSRDRPHFDKIIVCLRDKNFLMFLGACVLAWLGTAAIFPFIALYMKEQIGLASDKVVLLEACSCFGVLFSSYLCGWLADRYGSRPLMLLSAAMFAVLPLLWFAMPRGHDWCLYPALVIAFLAGITGTLWGIGVSRYFYNTVVSEELRSACTSIWCACGGLVGGAAPLLSGWVLDSCRGIDLKIWVFHLDSYSPLFAVCIVSLVFTVILMRRMRSDSTISTGRFVGMFFRGNPIAAMSSLVRFRLAGDEVQRLASTHGMARAQNPLNVEELVEALHDPSFNVRYEAIISIANMRPDPRLIEALLTVLNAGELDLAPTAAWALGKLGDPAAVTDLRKCLVSEYPVMRARGARALEMLRDTDSIPYLSDSLAGEIEPDVRLAYAATLARLGDPAVLPTVLDMLRPAANETIRSELSLAVARLVGNERQYTRLWRNLSRDVATGAGQVMLTLRKELRQPQHPYGHLSSLAGRSAQEFAHGQLDEGIVLLVDLIAELPTDRFAASSAQVMDQCAACLREFGSSRQEYIVLALHVINLEMRRFNSNSRSRD